MTRRNRFNPEDKVHVEVRQTPAAYNRVTRRAAGLRAGVHVEAMRAFYAVNTVLPRAVRRVLRENEHAEHRMAKNRARVDRLITPYQRST